MNFQLPGLLPNVSGRRVAKNAPVYALECPMAIQFGVDETGVRVAAQSFNGHRGVINGIIRDISLNPSPRHDGTGLSANTTYWAYLELIDGEAQIVINTNTPIADLTGQSVDHTDHSRTLIGMCHMNSAAGFEASIRHQLCATWNNRLPNQIRGRLGSPVAVTAKTGWATVHADTKVDFVSWGYAQPGNVAGYVTGNAVGMTVDWALMLDRGTASETIVVQNSLTIGVTGYRYNIAMSGQFFTKFSSTPNPSDGYHTLELVAWPIGGTATFGANTEINSEVWN